MTVHETVQQLQYAPLTYLDAGVTILYPKSTQLNTLLDLLQLIPFAKLKAMN